MEKLTGEQIRSMFLNYFKENKDKYKSLISIIKNLNNIWDIKINNRTFKDRDSFVDGFKKINT